MDYPLTLAYLGDAVYELYIREYLINKNLVKVNDLMKESIKYVSAKAQCRILEDLIENDIITLEEQNIVKKGRNKKSHRAPKNTDILTYKHSTGFECLIGYLYLNDKDRLEQIMNYILKGE